MKVEEKYASMEIITLEKAYGIVMNSVFRTGKENISYRDSLNRILAGDIFCDTDMPPFNKSSVDGFACRKSELDSELEIIETIRAGRWPGKAIGHLQCSRIMTGAAVPEGADCVVMVEDTTITGEGKLKFNSTLIKENIAFKGEDVKRGDVVLKHGKLIRPQDIAVMATAGSTSVVVNCKPLIAVLSSGDELVEPEVFPGISQIRNSNAYQLMAQIERAGATGNYYGIARDDRSATFEIVDKAISENDILLITGGVSMGDFDFIPEVLKQAGVNILFSRVAVQPGKPTTFGIHRKALVFGLPGNPVSSFIQFELLVRPLISKMMGYEWKPPELLLPMGTDFKRKFAGRMAWIPVKITDDRLVEPVEYHGSAHISALPGSDGIIPMQVGVSKLKKGEIVSVRQI